MTHEPMKLVRDSQQGTKTCWLFLVTKSAFSRIPEVLPFRLWVALPNWDGYLAYDGHMTPIYSTRERAMKALVEAQLMARITEVPH